MCSPFFPTFPLTLPNSFLGMGGKCIAFANGWIVIYAFYLSLEFGCTFFVWNQHLNYLQCTSNRLNFQHTSSSPLAIFIPWWDQNDVWNISQSSYFFFAFELDFVWHLPRLSVRSELALNCTLVLRELSYVNGNNVQISSFHLSFFTFFHSPFGLFVYVLFRASSVQ